MRLPHSLPAYVQAVMYIVRSLRSPVAARCCSGMHAVPTKQNSHTPCACGRPPSDAMCFPGNSERARPEAALSIGVHNDM